MSNYTVNLVIGSESDLYCPYNNDCELDEGVTEYIIRKAKGKKSGENIVIKIISGEPVDEERVRSAFNKFYEETALQNKRMARKNGLKQLWMFIIGIVFIGLSIILDSKIDMLVFQIISTIGAFAIWEASSIWIVDNPALTITKIVNKKLLKDLTIEFEVKNKAE